MNREMLLEAPPNPPPHPLWACIHAHVRVGEESIGQ